MPVCMWGMALTLQGWFQEEFAKQTNPEVFVDKLLSIETPDTLNDTQVGRLTFF